MKRLVLLMAVMLSLVLGSAAADAPPSFLLKWGSLGTGPGQFRSPRGVVVDASNSVYVADRMNSRIQKFDSNGTYMTEWSSSTPHAIAVAPSGNIYVTSEIEDMVSYYSPSGALLGTWGGTGNPPGRFDGPRGITVDQDGNVYVIDDNNVVQKFTSTGDFLLQWGTAGEADGEFFLALSVASDGNGHIFASDQHRIQEFSTSGNFIRSWLVGGRATFLICDSAGNVIATDVDNDNVKRFTSDGSLTLTFGSSGNGDGQFIDPTGVAVAPNGDIYVTDSMNGFQGGGLHNRVQKFGEIPIPTRSMSWGQLKAAYH